MRASVATGDEYVRIYVVLNGSFIQLGTDEAPYLEKNITAGSSSINIDLTASSGYKVYAVLGAKSGSLWTPTYYGGTDAFTVNTGVYTNQTITVKPVAGSYTASSGPAGALSIDGTLWVLTSGSLNGVSLSECGTVYSLTKGRWFTAGGTVSEPWINASNGIYTIKDGALLKRASLVAKYSTALLADGRLIVVYYGSDAGFASTDNTSATAVDSAWTANDLTTFLKTDDGAGFKDMIGDVSTLVNDASLIIDGDSSFGFVATSLGTYLFNEQMKSAMGTTKDSILAWVKGQLKSSTYAVSLYDAGKSVTISALAFDSESSPSYIYAGSSSGLYFASASGLPAATKTPALTLIASSRVTKLAAATFAGSSYVAYADNEGTVSILKDQSSSVSSYPFYSYAAVKDGLRDLKFYESGSTLHLLISSSDGVMDLVVR
jgi:hypothetical protein